MMRFIPCLFSLFFVVSCVPMQHEEPVKTQLEIREYQTKTFDVSDQLLVMKSILLVLQDDGYMVKNANSELGFVSATKEVGIHSARLAARDQAPAFALASDMSFGFSIGRGTGLRNRFPANRRPNPTYPTHESIEATINVSQFGQASRVRASFQSKVFDNHEAVLRVQQIADEQFYQDFFFKVDKGLFIDGQDI